MTSVRRILRWSLSRAWFAAYRLLQERLRRGGYSPGPRSILIQLTYTCNLRCWFCNQWGTTGVYKELPSAELRKTLPLSTLTKMLDELPLTCGVIMLWGGETLQYPDLIPLVRHIKQSGFGCSLITNGTSLAKKASVQEAHGLTSCAEWTGVPLSLLMQEVGVQGNAKWIMAMSADSSNHASAIPMEKVMSDGMIVYAMNGDALRIDHGYPLRLLLPGYGGRINVKWLDRLKVVDQPYMTKQDRTSYMQHTPAGEGAFLLTTGKAIEWHFAAYAKSVITSPTGGQKLPGPGLLDITGLAWSGGGKVRKVEVSTDGGRTWKDAQLQEPILPIAHTRFHFPWRWNGEEAKLQSRCTDEHGTVQPAAGELEKNWDSDLSANCTEYMGDDCRRIPRRAHRAYIMTWQVNRDGTVLNASNDIKEDTAIEGGEIHH